MAVSRSMKMNDHSAALIAPCGMNCRLCLAFIRDKNACPGCRMDNGYKSKSCISCRIKNCEKLASGEFEYCFSCEDFPCARLKNLDKRYTTKYGCSPIENLESIQSLGIMRFIRKEEEKWACPQCGSLLCVHKPECLSCQTKWH